MNITNEIAEARNRQWGKQAYTDIGMQQPENRECNEEGTAYAHPGHEEYS